MSISISIKIETKPKFMGNGCNVKELLSDWQMLVLFNDNSLTNKMDRVGKKQLIEMCE